MARSTPYIYGTHAYIILHVIGTAVGLEPCHRASDTLTHVNVHTYILTYIIGTQPGSSLVTGRATVSKISLREDNLLTYGGCGNVTAHSSSHARDVADHRLAH
eukprot:3205781-Pleurochrysis_carterae.AAC.1